MPSSLCLFLVSCIATVFGCLPTVPYDNTALPGSLFSPATSSPLLAPSAEIPDKLSAPLTEVVITPTPPLPFEKEEKRTTTVESVDPPCPPSWTKFSSPIGYKKCYQQITGDFDYLGAKYDCQSRGARIATIMTAEEYVFLKDLCTTGRTLYLEAIPYIGLVRDDVIGHVKWEGRHSEGFLKFYKDREPPKTDGNCFKLVTDQTIADGDLLHDGLAGYYVAVDCLLPSRSSLCQIDL